MAAVGAAGFARHPDAFLRQPDFALTYIAAKETGRPEAMYEPRAMSALARTHRVNGYAPGNWFLYPPGVAILFLPFAALPYTTAAVLWLLISAAGLVWGTWMVLSLLRFPPRARGALAVGVLAIPPSLQMLVHGQTDWILLLALVAVGSTATPRGSMSSAGALTGLAAALKIFPCLFFAAVPPRHVRPMILGALASASVIVLAGAIPGGGFSLISYWLESLHAHAARDFSAEVSNQSLSAVLARLVGHGTAGIEAMTAVLLTGCVAVVLATTRPRGPLRIDRLLRLTSLTALALLLLPISWDHYPVLLVPGAATLHLAARRSPPAWGLYLAGSSLLVLHRFWRWLVPIAGAPATALACAGTVLYLAASLVLLRGRHAPLRAPHRP